MHAHCKALAAQLEGVQDPSAALSIAVPLLAAQVYFGSTHQLSVPLMEKRTFCE